jgi:hypothetical protein
MVMTSLVPVSEVFATGAPVKKRYLWSGEDRKNRAIVGGRKDAYKLRPKATVITGWGALAHNGLDTYVVASGTALFTTPDLLVGTSRSVSNPPTGLGNLLHYKGSFFYSYPAGGPSLATARSADKGVTWAAYGAAGGMLSVVGDLLYIVPQPIGTSPPATSSFSTTSDPAVAPTARAFSRSAYWTKVVGNSTRQYCFGSPTNSPTNGTPWIWGEVSTNGTSFSQDTGFETLAARAPMTLRNACSLAAGRVMAYGVSAAGLFSLVADAAGVWSVGAQIPGELGDGYRLHSPGLVGTYSVGASSYTDADGITHVLVIAQDAAGNFMPRVACTVDGVEWWFLPPHANLGTSQPTAPLGVFSTIGGLLLANYDASQLVEANPAAVELYYEV